MASPGGNGKLLFLREARSALWSQGSIHPGSRSSGEPAPVCAHVGHNPAFRFFDASANALVYRNALVKKPRK
jgi:hypothetical protein